MFDECKKILEVCYLKQYFNVGKKDEVWVVDDVFFDIYEGEIFGLVGEFGLGKIMIGCFIIYLYELIDGEIIFDGKDVFKLYIKKECYEFCWEI